MINVSNLTKRFASRIVVDNVSFSVQGGEIAGLVGPNGAGKTTIMRILAGYIPATSGTATIDGLDVCDCSLETRRRIGYLPETLGLYPDMRVDEFLMFRAALKGVRRSERKQRVEEVKSTCGLETCGRRIIGQLSRGRSQMVGMADAMVHDPKILILDEPTMGLDPNEARNVRKLICNLGNRYTVLMSTHFLDEAEQMCRRVVVLNDGTVVALSSPEDLVQGEPNQTRLNAEIYGSCVQISGELAKLTNVLSVSCCPSAGRNAANESEPAWRRYTIECGGRSDIRLDIFDVARRNGWKLRDLSLQKKRLGDFFVEMTAGGGKS